MNIKVNQVNKTEIEAALHAVNGRATRHAYTDFSEVEDIAVLAEKKLIGLKLPLALRPGALWVETSGLPVANAYNNKRTGTQVTLQRKSVGWVLVDVKCVTLYKEGGGAGKLTLTRKQYDEAAKRLMAGIEVAKSDAE